MLLYLVTVYCLYYRHTMLDVLYLTRRKKKRNGRLNLMYVYFFIDCHVLFAFLRICYICIEAHCMNKKNELQ